MAVASDVSQTTTTGLPTINLARNTIPPFIPSHDFARGVFVVFQAAITYALMLSIMYVPPSCFCEQQK